MVDHQASEPDPEVLEVTFNRAVKIRAKDHRLTSDAGALLLREADERLGLISSLANNLIDNRDKDKIRYSIAELVRERIFCYALGYHVADDVDRLAHDPALRISTWDNKGSKVIDERLASQPTQSRLIDTLSIGNNRIALSESLADWTNRHLRASGSFGSFVSGSVDIDGFPVTVHGNQEGAEYNGYCKRKVYYPFAASFAPEGHYDSCTPGDGFVHAILRDGNASAHEGALDFIREAYRRCSNRAETIDIRMDAGFAVQSVLDGLKEDGINYVARLRSNRALDRLSWPHVKRPAGRPPADGYEYTVELGEYQAESWRHPARIVLCVVDKPDPKTGLLDLFPNYFILVTSWGIEKYDGNSLLDHYRKRGTFEDRFGELNQAIKPRLSSPRFFENEAIILLSLLAYNLVNIMRREMEFTSPDGHDLGRFQSIVLKVGGRLIKSGRQLIVEIAQAALPLWKCFWRRINSWKLPEAELPCFRPSPRPWNPPPSHANMELVLIL